MTARPPMSKRSSESSARHDTAMSSSPNFVGKKRIFGAKRRTKIAQCVAWYKTGYVEKIHVIRSGVSAQRIDELALVMDIPEEVLTESLGLSRKAVSRKVRNEQALSPAESERVMGMLALIGQVQIMIDIEIAPTFDAATWLGSWLAAPLAALNGAIPLSFMDTVEGQKYIGNLLATIQSGAYA